MFSQARSNTFQNEIFQMRKLVAFWLEIEYQALISSSCPLADIIKYGSLARTFAANDKSCVTIPCLQGWPCTHKI